MMQWFGASWNAPINDLEHVATPAGRKCIFCARAIEVGDRGVVMTYVHDLQTASREPAHLLCFFKDSMGGEMALEIYRRLPQEEP